MSRQVIIIRHAKSTGNRHNRAAFGVEGAPLDKVGIASSKKLTKQLETLGINVPTEPVAASELIRTEQTARYAGFKNIQIYSVLNEVNSGLAPNVLDDMLEQKQVPEAAIIAARKLLSNPPSEKVWVTHGMLIAALAHELGIPTSELFIPDMGSITVLQLP